MTSHRRVLFVTSHPIQYLSPWFRALEKESEIDLSVWYVTIPNKEMQGTGFGQSFDWDVPVLDGYQWECLTNISKKPSLGHFRGSKVRNIRNKIKQHGPEFIVVLGWHQLSLVQVAFAARLLNIPCFVRGDSNGLIQRSWLKRLRHKIFLKLFTGFLYVGAKNKDFYQQNGVRDNQLFFVPHFVDNAWFISQRMKFVNTRSHLRSENGIKRNETVFIYVGKLQKKKNLYELVSAFRQLVSTSDDVRLIIVGSGEMENQLKVFSESCGGKVIFTGFLNQTALPEKYFISDCLILPSDAWETWGLVVNEAMNFRMPVIVSDKVGCGDDLVRNNETGMIYSFGNTGDLCHAMRKMHSDQKLREKMGENAERHIANYSIKAATVGLMKAIHCHS